MKDAAESLPSDLAAAHAMILAERHARVTAEANAVAAATNAAVEKRPMHRRILPAVKR
jgi:hypothetical protein